MKKFAVGVLVGVMTLMFGSVTAFAITPAEEAEARYQAEKEAAEMAEMAKYADIENAAQDAIVNAATEKESAYDQYVVDQAAYFEAKDAEYFAAIVDAAASRAAAGAKVEYGYAADKANGLQNKADSLAKDADFAQWKYDEAKANKQADSELAKLQAAADGAAAVAEAAQKAAKSAADAAAAAQEACESAISYHADTHADWVAAANAMYAALSVF